MATPSALTVLWSLLTLLLLTGCEAHNPYYDPDKRHHTPAGFRNNYPHEPQGSFWRWRWQRFWAGLPKEPAGGYRPERVQPDLAFLSANRTESTLTWIGHATFLLQVGGLNILTDPHCSERASPLSFLGPRRRVPPALTIEELPLIDAVVISHNHYDHLDRSTVKRLAAQAGGSPRFFVPLGLRPWFVRQGVHNVVELDWWSAVHHRGVDFHFVPTQHFSARTPFDRSESLWGGWVIASRERKVLFVGDAGYSRDFHDIGRRFRLDLAALPIGAYEPRWFMKPMHLNPEEAIQAYQDLGAQRAVAMHWGTFALTDEPLDEPPQRLRAALTAAGVAAERFAVLKHGETLRLSRGEAD